MISGLQREITISLLNEKRAAARKLVYCRRLWILFRSFLAGIIIIFAFGLIWFSVLPQFVVRGYSRLTSFCCCSVFGRTTQRWWLFSCCSNIICCDVAFKLCFELAKFAWAFLHELVQHKQRSAYYLFSSAVHDSSLPLWCRILFGS